MELSYFDAGWPAGGGLRLLDCDFGGIGGVEGEAEEDEDEVVVVLAVVACSRSRRRSSNAAIVGTAASVACVWREKSGLKSIWGPESQGSMRML